MRTNTLGSKLVYSLLLVSSLFIYSETAQARFGGAGGVGGAGGAGGFHGGGMHNGFNGPGGVGGVGGVGVGGVNGVHPGYGNPGVNNYHHGVWNNDPAIVVGAPLDEGCQSVQQCDSYGNCTTTQECD